MLAVNAYDEPREKVEAFAKSRKLTHPILLMGRKVAKNDYLVTGYPTAYWIDREGRIIERTVGFRDGQQTKLEQRLIELLAKRR